MLDSNFWLSTHVVAVTTGYAATFLAGFLAIIYVVLRGVLTPSLDKDSADSLALAWSTALSASRRYSVSSALSSVAFGPTNPGAAFSGVGIRKKTGRSLSCCGTHSSCMLVGVVIVRAPRTDVSCGLRQHRDRLELVWRQHAGHWSPQLRIHRCGLLVVVDFVATQLALIGIGLIPRNRWRSAA